MSIDVGGMTAFAVTFMSWTFLGRGLEECCSTNVLWVCVSDSAGHPRAFLILSWLGAWSQETREAAHGLVGIPGWSRRVQRVYIRCVSQLCVALTKIPEGAV